MFRCAFISLITKPTVLCVLHIISALIDGVGALISATKSDNIKSISCPTADIVNFEHLFLELIKNKNYTK